MTTPNDLPPDTPPAATAVATVTPAVEPASDRAVRVTCEFCGCKLTGGGEIIKLGDEARRYRKLDDKLEEVAAERDTATARVRELDDENATLRASSKKRGLFER